MSCHVMVGAIYPSNMGLEDIIGFDHPPNTLNWVEARRKTIRSNCTPLVAVRWTGRNEMSKLQAVTRGLEWHEDDEPEATSLTWFPTSSWRAHYSPSNGRRRRFIPLEIWTYGCQWRALGTIILETICGSEN